MKYVNVSMLRNKLIWWWTCCTCADLFICKVSWLWCGCQKWEKNHMNQNNTEELSHWWRLLFRGACVHAVISLPASCGLFWEARSGFSWVDAAVTLVMTLRHPLGFVGSVCDWSIVVSRPLPLVRWNVTQSKGRVAEEFPSAEMEEKRNLSPGKKVRMALLLLYYDV